MINSDTESEEFIDDHGDSSSSREENHCGCTINTIKNSIKDNSEY